jgi:hypothetical protein
LDSFSCVASSTIFRVMPTICISDSGDDKNDGLSTRTAIYSLKRAKELARQNDFSWHFGPRAWKRIQKELSEKREEKDKPLKRLRRPVDSEANR